MTDQWVAMHPCLVFYYFSSRFKLFKQLYNHNVFKLNHLKPGLEPAFIKKLNSLIDLSNRWHGNHINSNNYTKQIAFQSSTFACST
jgi:hypothetical protein